MSHYNVISINHSCRCAFLFLSEKVSAPWAKINKLAMLFLSFYSFSAISRLDFFAIYQTLKGKNKFPENVTYLIVVLIFSSFVVRVFQKASSRHWKITQKYIIRRISKIILLWRMYTWCTKDFKYLVCFIQAVPKDVVWYNICYLACTAILFCG